MCGTPVLLAQEEGGPVYPNDKDVGGGARDVTWSATIAGKSEPGERLILTGTVFDGDDGKPREGVTVYAYHTDARGHYCSKPWGRPRLRGWARTNAEGRYEFHTIKPGPYPMRRNPAHIHMTIAIPGRRSGGFRNFALGVIRSSAARKRSAARYGTRSPAFVLWSGKRI
jgi:protocatechuate 3,4-dioxygenase beta subunit